jgi:guanine nucleotide exchange protein RalF
MYNKIEGIDLDIIKTFNSKPKEGIKKIKELCERENIPSAQGIAEFFHQYKDTLDLSAVGDYLGTKGEENAEVLKSFVEAMDFRGQDIVKGVRSFLQEFKLPGEGQKIGRLVEAFSKTYYDQNPGGDIAHRDAAELLVFQIIILNTDLHNVSIAEKDKMTLAGLKINLRGFNKEEQGEDKDFDEQFLENIYNNIKAEKFELNFVKTNPGYELNSNTLNNDPTFNNLNSVLSSTEVNIQNIFSGIGDDVKATVDKPTSILNIFTGYKGTLTLKDEKTLGQATVQVYNPSFFSKVLFGKQPKVIIQPVYEEGTNYDAQQESINLAAKVAARFTSSVNNTKATYNYEQSDLENAYKEQKNLVSIEKTKSFKERLPKEESKPTQEHDNTNTPKSPGL